MAPRDSNHQTNKNPEKSLEEQEHHGVSVVIVPFPAQGHLNQLLQLSCLISSYRFPVHYVGSEIHNRQAKIRANGLDPSELAKIQFHDLPTPEFPSPAPNPNAPTKFPSHLEPSWDATMALREPVAAVLRDLASCSRRIVVIHDPLVAAVVQDSAAIENAEAYMFHCIPAFTTFFAKWEDMGRPELPIEAVPSDVPNWDGCLSEGMFRIAALQIEHMKFQAGEIYNSSRLVEGTYLDLLGKEKFSGNRKLWAIGPIFPVKISVYRQHKCLEWLDRQPPKSVIYVSFGTMTSVSDEEVRELAIGLEQSRQRFIWVLRDADKADIFDGEVRKFKLPEGFEERVQESGIIVRDWAPQPEILAHPATGGFMSHCGWNSCMESLTMGVPIAAWPMHSDQARNTVLITEILKVGLVVREWKLREELFKACGIAEKVRRLMAEEEGGEIRKRAEGLGDALRKSKEEGGVSRLELESFVAHITR